MREFTYSSQTTRVVFGTGTLDRLREEVERLGCSRVLVLTGPRQAHLADRVRDLLGPAVADEFTGAATHTPTDVTARAMKIVRAQAVDCLVAVGGGSVTGLSKALSLRTGLSQIVVPTTYAGSEATPVLGETENGVKVVRSGPELLPGTVVYDVALTTGLPVPLSVASGINALAHAVEALYSDQANPVTDELALRAITLLGRALPAIAADPGDTGARASALEAAWLAGTCLGTVGMGLHHKLCHTLGGAFGLPHAETHTVVLPHVMAYNAPAAAGTMRQIARALGAADAPTAVHDLVRDLGGPTSLRELGLAEADLARAADLAIAVPYPNPRAVTRDGVATLLGAAWHGTRPAPADPVAAELAALTARVTASFDRTPEPRTRELLTDLVRRLHGFVADHHLTDDEWHQAVDFLTRTGQMSGDTRQEVVLLSDTLGVSSAVDLLTNSRTPSGTPSAVLGPFYVEGPPVMADGADIAAGLAGSPLYASVVITGADGRPLPDAVVDVWQADDDGFYDVQLPDLDCPVLRGRFRSDPQGRVRFRSIVPREYPIPADGPVGQLLAAVRRHPFRAPHVHFMISAAGHRRLVTQLFVAGGAYLDSDTVFGVKDALVVDFAQRPGPAPDGAEGPWHALEFTFRLAPA